MIDAHFRPVPMWPHGSIPADARRSRWTFKVPWSNTLDLLDRELLAAALKATHPDHGGDSDEFADVQAHPAAVHTGGGR